MKADMDPYYTYIFVRQDIAPEQQLVQAAHVACVLGKLLPDFVDPNYLHFVVIGVPDLISLSDAATIMRVNEIPYTYFEEGHFEDEVTAIASCPIRGEVRNVFEAYKTLKF